MTKTKTVSTKAVPTNAVVLTKAQVKTVHTLGDSLLVGEAAGIKADSGYKAINKMLESIEVLWPECRGNGYQSAKDLGIDEATYKKVLGTLEAICAELADMGVQTAAKNIKQNISRHSVHKIAQKEAAKAKREAAKAANQGEEGAANDEPAINLNKLAAFLTNSPANCKLVGQALIASLANQIKAGDDSKGMVILRDAAAAFQDGDDALTAFIKLK